MNTTTPVIPLLGRKRRRDRLRILVLAIALSPWAISPAQDEPPAPGQSVRVEPDARYQSAIEAVAGASSKEQIDEQLEDLDSLVGGEHAALMQQLLHFLAHSQNPNAEPAAGRILRRIDVPAHSAVAALVPNLLNENPAIVERVRELLRHYEDRSASRAPDFSGYRAFVEAEVRARREPSFELVRFMYESDPGLALLTLMRAYQLRKPAEIRTILWAEHVVAELLWKRQHGFLPPDAVEPAAIEQLGLLSRHRAWWARAYVLELLRRHPEFRTDDLIARLRQDVHPRLRAQTAGLVAPSRAIDDMNPSAQQRIEDPGRQ